MEAAVKLAHIAFWAVLLLCTLAGVLVGQSLPTSDQTLQTGASLVLLDVFTLDSKTGLPFNQLKREDFQVTDNGKLVPLPTHDIDQAIAATEKALQKRPFKNPSCDPKLPNRASACPGERALREMMQKILQNTRDGKPERVPVIVFLYGDHSGMPEKAVDEMVDNVLATSGVVFGITDITIGPSQSHWNRSQERGAIIHYMVAETGGQYFAVPENLYGTALDSILMQLHFRYELGFKPTAVDGKRHAVQVELVGDAKEKYGATTLRYRPAYIPTP